MSAPLRTTLRRIVAEHPSVHILGEALELSPATMGLMGTHPERVHLLPAADASLVGTAVGMAITGATPIVELAGGPSLWAALAQLGQEAAALTGSEFSLSVIVRVPLAPGASVPAELLAGVPGLVVAGAGSSAAASALLEAALAWRGPVVILEPAESMVCAGTQGPARLGVAQTLRSGDHVSLLAFGAGVPAALAAADTLAEQGVLADVVDLCCLQPLDVDTVGASIQHTGRAVLVGAPEGALVSAIQAAFLRLESPPRSVTADPQAVVDAALASLSY